MGNIIAGFSMLLIGIFMVYGWIMNIVWIANQQVIVWSGEMIISAIGIFVVPLGSIVGLLVH